MLLVTLVVASLLGWWVDRWSLAELVTKRDRERERAEWDAEALKGVVKASGGHADIMLSGIHAKFPIPGGGMADSWQYFDAESPTTVPEPSMPPRVELP
jgi:hypothetical protein